MKLLTAIGMVLALLGIVALIYGGITYTSSDNVVDMGSVHIQIDQKKQILRSPLAGLSAMAAGIILFLVGQRKSNGSSRP